MRRRRFLIPDLTNERFGRLKVLYRTDHTDRARYACECDCGKIVTTLSYSLYSGATKSCGCYMRDVSRESCLSGACSAVKHACTKAGEQGPRAYRAWKRARRTNKQLPEFLKFCKIIGPCPESPRVRLYRRPNGTYEWSTRRLVKD